MAIRPWRMRPSFALALLLGTWSLALPAGAQVYRWVDPDGSIHYSDSPSSAPRGTKVETTTGDDITVEGSGRIEAGTPPGNPPVPAQQPSPGASGDWSQDDTPQEQTVRQYFRDTHQKIAATKALLEQQRQTVKNYQTGAVPQCTASTQECADWRQKVRASHDEAVKRLAELEAELRKWTSYLDDLERWASSKSVPRAWRE